MILHGAKLIILFRLNINKFRKFKSVKVKELESEGQFQVGRKIITIKTIVVSRLWNILVKFIFSNTSTKEFCEIHGTRECCAIKHLPTCFFSSGAY